MANDEWPKAERLFKLAGWLREGYCTMRDLMLRLDPTLGVDSPEWRNLERSVQRDLEDLARLKPDLERLMRIPLYSVHSAKSAPCTLCRKIRIFFLLVTETEKFRTFRNFSEFVSGAGRRATPFPPTAPTYCAALHPVEALALHAATQLIYHRSPGHSLHHKNVLNRLTSWLPDPVRGVVERSVSDVGKRQSKEDLNLEHAAWLNGHPLLFEYRVPGGGQWRANELYIYLLETHPVNLDLYAIVFETSFYGCIRTFKLSRRRQVSVVREQRYQIPADFEPREFFNNTWGVVGDGASRSVTLRLRFCQDAAYRILEGGYPNLSEPVLNADHIIDTTVQAPLDGSGLLRELRAAVQKEASKDDALLGEAGT